MLHYKNHIFPANKPFEICQFLLKLWHLQCNVLFSYGSNYGHRKALLIFWFIFHFKKRPTHAIFPPKNFRLQWREKTKTIYIQIGFKFIR